MIATVVGSGTAGDFDGGDGDFACGVTAAFDASAAWPCVFWPACALAAWTFDGRVFAGHAPATGVFAAGFLPAPVCAGA